MIPKRLIYPLWAIAVFRMCLPVALSSSVSIFNFFGNFIKKIIPSGQILDANLSVSNYFNTASSYYPMEYKTQRLSEIFHTSTIIWSVGVLITLSIVCLLYCAVLYQYRSSIQIQGSIYHNQKADAPFLLGMIKPKIILPMDIDVHSPQAAHIIDHEKVHMKRGDNVWRLLGLMVTCLHWFNPIAWIGFSCFLKDMELSCDEIAIKNYDTNRRSDYAKSLLAMAEKSQKQGFIPVAFGRSDAKTRITGVLTYQKLPLFGTVVSIGFLMTIAIMFMTNPKV
jgi:beta-lactamase regulating signal transducer with metallopeptidase domain